MTRLQIIGGGRMGEALVSGIISSGSVAARDVTIVEVDPDRRADLADRLDGVTLVTSPTAADGTVLAVKPPQVCDSARAAAAAGGGRLLSIAAGITTASIEESVGAGSVVVRAMPNTPALVGQAATAIAPGSAAGAADLDWAEELLTGVGVVVRVTESQLDAVTALSGSGPAYVFLVVEALIEAGVLCGLGRDLATALATQTVLGAATLLDRSDDGPEALRAAVTSPGGTTAAGLRALEDRAVRAAFIDAVTAAAQRAEDLSK